MNSKLFIFIFFYIYLCVLFSFTCQELLKSLTGILWSSEFCLSCFSYEVLPYSVLEALDLWWATSCFSLLQKLDCDVFLLSDAVFSVSCISICFFLGSSLYSQTFPFCFLLQKQEPREHSRSKCFYSIQNVDKILAYNSILVIEFSKHCFCWDYYVTTPWSIIPPGSS